jgi:hypothetical protein
MEKNKKYYSPFFEERFYSTLGYLLLLDEIEPITQADALSAREHYKEDLDSYLEHFMGKAIPTVIDRQTLWAAIAADRESFFTGNYLDYIYSGEDMWEEALLQFTVESYASSRYINEEGFRQAQREAQGILQERGFIKINRPTPPEDLKVPPPLESGASTRYYDKLEAEDIDDEWS